MKLALFFAASLLLAGPAHAAPSQQDTDTYKQFEETVADLAVPDKIETWEAFLKKYPHSSFAPQVKKMVADLKAGKAPAAAPTAAPVVVAVAPSSTPRPAATPLDPDLSFLYESPAPASTPSRASTPAPKAAAEPSIFDSSSSSPSAYQAPKPTPAPTPDLSIFDPPKARAAATPAPTPVPAPQRAVAVATPTPAPKPAAEPSFFDAQPQTRVAAVSVPAASRPRPVRAVRAPVESEGDSHRSFFSSTHTELSLFGAMSPDETLVQNQITGATLTERIGRYWGFSLEGAASQGHETTLLQTLRAANKPPEVISRFKYLAGVAVKLNALSAIDTTGRLSDRNDLFLSAGGGIVNTEVDVCKAGCTSTLVVPSINFEYATIGVGHRFYLTPWLAIGSEFRERVVFEVIDGAVKPRTNLQINVGPSVTF